MAPPGALSRAAQCRARRRRARARGLPRRPAGRPGARPKTVRRGRAIASRRDGGPLVVAHDRRRTIAIVARGGRADRRRRRAAGRAGDLARRAVRGRDDRLLGPARPDLRRPRARCRVGATGAKPGPAAASASALAERGSGGSSSPAARQEGQLRIFDPRTGAVLARAPLGRVPRGVAATPDGSAAWIALNGQDEVVRVSAATGAVTRRLPTPRLPDAVAISPDGRRLLLSHGGLDDEHVTEIDLTLRQGRRPAARRPAPERGRLDPPRPPPDRARRRRPGGCDHRRRAPHTPPRRRLAARSRPRGRQRVDGRRAHRARREGARMSTLDRRDLLATAGKTAAAAGVAALGGGLLAVRVEGRPASRRTC